MVSKPYKPSLFFLSFLQAIGLSLYVGLISMIIWKGNAWFGPLGAPLGPFLFLILFVVSAIISSAIVLGYPFWLFWEKKQTQKALTLVAATTAWLALFFFIGLSIVILRL